MAFFDEEYDNDFWEEVYEKMNEKRKEKFRKIYYPHVNNVLKLFNKIFGSSIVERDINNDTKKNIMIKNFYKLKKIQCIPFISVLQPNTHYIVSKHSNDIVILFENCEDSVVKVREARLVNNRKNVLFVNNSISYWNYEKYSEGAFISFFTKIRPVSIEELLTLELSNT